MLRNGIGSLSRLLLILLLVSAICAAVTIQNLGQRDDSLCNKGERQATAALDTINAEAAVEQHGPVDPAMLGTLIEQIHRTFDAHDYVSVDSLCRRADSILGGSASSDTAALQSMLYYWAGANYHLGRIKQALGHGEDLVAIRRAFFGNADSSTAEALAGLSELYRCLSDYGRAIAAATEAIHVADSCHDISRSLRAMYVGNLGMIYKSQGDLLSADSVLTRALEIIQDTITPDELDVSAYQISMATLYLAQRRLDEAEPLLEKAYEIRVRLLGPKHRVVATASALLATVHWLRGNFAKAEAWFQKALDINRKSMGPGYVGVARILIEMGLMYHDMGRYNNSQAYYDTALALLTNGESMEKRSDIAACLNRMGNLHSDLGDLELAESNIREALAIRSEMFGNDNLITGYSMVSLGQLYIKMDRLEEAEKLLTDGAALERKSLGPLHPSLSAANISLAVLFALQGDAERSLRYYSDALGARWRVMRAVFVASGERDKLNWIRKYPLMDQSLLTRAAGAHGEAWIRPALEMVLRGKCAVIDALAAAREAAFCSNDAWVDQAWKGRSNLCREIANVSLGHIPESWESAVDDSLRWLYTALDSVESELGQRCSEFGNTRMKQNVALNDILAAIPDGTAYWEFMRYVPYDHRSSVTDTREPRYLAFVLIDSSQYQIVDVGEAHRIDSLIFSVRDMIERAGTKVYGSMGTYFEDKLKDTLSVLYSIVFAPLQRQSQNRRTIVIAPDGALNLIPFEIMVDSSGAYAAETYTISYASSARDLVLRRDRLPSSDEVIIVSNPDFDDRPAVDPGAASFSLLGDVDWVRTGASDFRTAVDCLHTEFASLPFTEYEAERVRHSFSQASHRDIILLDGAQASEQALKNLAEPPRVLHLATHGFACPAASNYSDDPVSNPLVACGLVLAGANLGAISGSESIRSGDDGILTALEVSGLNLVGTELVTLSACESGLGDVMGGEGVFGLRRAFQHAGARSIVMSMFAVPDESTSELMERFYANWLSGQSKASALRSASLSILNERRNTAKSTHPLFWGGFILVGDPD